jgi:gamma-glutamyl:cysteine ligase YbdK (ATP-grasp superfamily)
MAAAGPYRLFEVVGVELEYMIVDRESLAVRPIADELLRADDGHPAGEIEVGEVAWSNELALHVIELKTNGPARSLAGLAAAFQKSVELINARLAPRGAMLMPTGMHPWMDPGSEARLWPHEHGPIYRAFDRIFGCRGHGWTNLQSVHLNLPFAGDEEFARLHAAIRLALPLLPALAASSPLEQGRLTGLLDTRLEHYRTNARRIPSVTGCVVPEPAFTRAQYEAEILAPIYADLARFDPEEVLRHEWVNARGCIARFDRSSLEIRLLDGSESPRADLAIADVALALVRRLAEGRLASPEAQRGWPAERLAQILFEVMRHAGDALVRDADYLRALGWPGAGPCTAGALWRHLARAIEPALSDGAATRAVLELILAQGCLARRITRRLGPRPDRARIEAVYRELCAVLASGGLFHAPD